MLEFYFTYLDLGKSVWYDSHICYKLVTSVTVIVSLSYDQEKVVENTKTILLWYVSLIDNIWSSE